MTKVHVPIPKIAMDAIQRGCVAKDPISNLEWLGVPLRVLHRLNEEGIVTLDELVVKQPDELLQIDSMGETSLRQLLTALSNYDQIKEKKEEQLAPSMRRRIRNLEAE